MVELTATQYTQVVSRAVRSGLIPQPPPASEVATRIQAMVDTLPSCVLATKRYINHCPRWGMHDVSLAQCTANCV